MFTRNGVWAIISRDKVKEHFHKIKSFRNIVFIVIVLIGVLPCFILSRGIVANYESRAVQLRTADIKTQCEIIVNQMGVSEYLEDPSSEVINAQITQLANFYNGRIMILNQDYKVIKDTFSINTGKTLVSEEVINCFKGMENSHYDKVNHYIEQAVCIGNSMTKDVVGVMLISVSTDSIVDSIDILLTKAYVLQLALSLAIIAIAFIVAKRLSSPFAEISKEITGMSEGFLNEEISVKSYREMELIIAAINKMINRMKVLDDSRQEFVSNVSHELKTPITSMKVLADSLLMQEEAPVELYKEFMTDIVAEIDRESKIIEDLLSLVKMDKTSQNLNIMPVNLNQLLELILKRLRPIAAKRNIELLMESFRPVTAEIDEVKMTLVVSDLVENAIKYNVDNGWVHVSLNADHKFFYISVEDSGIGIPEESQEYIFERFYRVDKSHSREIGGTGLGLAITRNAVLLHRGTIKVSSEEGKGTTFTVRIPLSYIAS